MDLNGAAGTNRGRESVFGWLTGVMNGLGTFWIFALMLIINADIIGRAGFNQPLQGVSEIVAMSIVGIVMLQLAHTLRNGRFLRSSLLMDTLWGGWPRAATALEALYNLVGVTMMSIIFYYGLGHFREAWEIGLYTGTFGQFTFPLWPIRLIVLVGVGMTGIQFLLLMLANLRRAFGAHGGEMAR